MWCFVMFTLTVGCFTAVLPMYFDVFQCRTLLLQLQRSKKAKDSASHSNYLAAYKSTVNIFSHTERSLNWPWAETAAVVFVILLCFLSFICYKFVLVISTKEKKRFFSSSNFTQKFFQGIINEYTSVFFFCVCARKISNKKRKKK